MLILETFFTTHWILRYGLRARNFHTSLTADFMIWAKLHANFLMNFQSAQHTHIMKSNSQTLTWSEYLRWSYYDISMLWSHQRNFFPPWSTSHVIEETTNINKTHDIRSNIKRNYLCGLWNSRSYPDIRLWELLFMMKLRPWRLSYSLGKFVVKFIYGKICL